MIHSSPLPPDAIPAAKPARWTPFAYGFRPFFLLAGLLALCYVPWWVGSVALGWPLSTDWPPTLWHGHEMLFGYIGAAIGGFLLTAVPSWTGQRGSAGLPLVALVVVWIAGRLAILSSAAWSPLATAIADLAFLPLLAGYVAVPLLRARSRNTPLLAVLGLLWACNVVFHVALARHDAPLAGQAVRSGLDIVLVLVTLIGGRIIPAFTNAAMKAQGRAPRAPSWPWLTPAVLATMMASAIVGLVTVPAGIVAAVSLVAGILHGLRLWQWRAPLRLMKPIVWILHLGYAWLAAGFVLRATALLAGSAWAAFWLHALTIGAVTSMILGVMTRAALGHTGRTLAVAPAITAAYVLVSAAALMRVFALGVAGLSYPIVLIIAGTLWLAAFALYVAVYAPILLRPRADGRPG